MFRKFITLLAAVFALNAFAAVDANQASRADLETVKGIGPGLSAKILKARETSAFKDWADMVQRVPGVGAGNAGKLSKAGLTVGGAAFDSSAIPAPKARARKADGGADKPARRAAKQAAA